MNIPKIKTIPNAAGKNIASAAQSIGEKLNGKLTPNNFEIEAALARDSARILAREMAASGCDEVLIRKALTEKFLRLKKSNVEVIINAIGDKLLKACKIFKK